MIKHYDHVIMGAGIIGLTIARELINKFPKSKILLIEKEPMSGLHGSGRNSGVMHSGIYYPPDSLKGIVCAEGSKRMADYCMENNLPINRMGKVVIPTKIEDDPQVELLYERAIKNSAKVELIDEQQLKSIEPEAKSISGRALYSPGTAVVDPKAILKSLVKELKDKGVKIHYLARCISAESKKSVINVDTDKISYGELYNATGQHADKVAKMFGAAKNYTSLPFKGMYYKLSPKSNIRFNGLIYPVPDLNVPFLGVHTVKTINNDQYLGPTAIPAFGRENYTGFEGVNLSESSQISYHLVRQYIKNNQGFRQYAHEEAFRFLKKNFTSAVQALVPGIKEEYLLPSNKVGIRAQLLNTKTNELEMDFLVERKGNTVHILNAVSPAFTSSLKFAELVVNKGV